MKKRLWTGLVLCVLAVTALTAGTKGEKKGVYMYGIATSLMDSVVYVTDIQQLEGAVVNSKNGFLEARSLYSEQLRAFLEQQGGRGNMTCAVCFHEKKHKIQKKHQKLQGQYAKKGIILKTLKDSEFKFEAIAPVTDEDTSAQEESK